MQTIWETEKFQETNDSKTSQKSLKITLKS